jgi:hypothetical protein
VVFQNFEESNELASKYVPLDNLTKFNSGLDPFLRGHFKWTLGVQFMGGDINGDYPDGAEDIWASPLGKEIEERLKNKSEYKVRAK